MAITTSSLFIPWRRVSGWKEYATPTPMKEKIQSLHILDFLKDEALPPVHKAKEKVPIVLGPKVVWVPINSPQFCQSLCL